MSKTEKQPRPKKQMVYVGCTMNSKGKLVGVWVQITANDGTPLKLDGLSDERTLWFTGPKLRRGRPGIIREFEYETKDGATSIYGTGEYIGCWACEEERAVWDAEDQGRKVARDRAKLDKDASSQSALREYLKPIAHGYIRCGTRAKKSAYLANIIMLIQNYG